MKRVAIIVLAASSMAPSAARAEPLFPARYVACRQLSAERRTEVPPTAVDDAVAVPRRKRAPTMKLLPLVVDDVAVSEPIPEARHTAADERVLVARAPDANDYLCIGIPRGRAGILGVLGAAPGTRWAHHENDSGWPSRNMRAAGVFQLREAIPLIRRELDRPIPSPVDYRTFERLASHAAAMRALADLGDTSVVSRIRAFAVEREDEPIPQAWHDAVETLARLEPKEAQSYAIELAERLVTTASTPVDYDRSLARADHLRTILSLFVEPSPRAVAALGKLDAVAGGESIGATGHDRCMLLATRIRMGDAVLKTALRGELEPDLNVQRAVGCYSEVIGAAFPGDDLDDLDAILHRHLYAELLHLLELERAREVAGSADPRWPAARKKLVTWLSKRLSDPDVAGDKSDNRHQPTTRALHLVAMAALGDTKAERDLFALVDDPKDDGVAPWIGALHAMRLGLGGARDHAAKRLSFGRDSSTSRYSTEPWPTRGDVTITEHGAVVDELAREGDDRFVLGLLDRDRFTRELTVSHVARLAPKRTCELVAHAASGAESEAIQDAFWALSALGNACLSDMEAIVSDERQSEDARGMAMELLAMMRAPVASRELPRSLAKASGTFRAALERASIILKTRE